MSTSKDLHKKTWITGFFILSFALAAGLSFTAYEAVLNRANIKAADEARYVEALIHGGTNPVGYIGRTTATYTGNLGGIAGANAKCNAQGGAFAGSHMCTQGEALRTGATSFVGSGWVACDVYVRVPLGAEQGSSACSGITQNAFAVGVDDETRSCAQWTWGADSTYNGPVMSSTGNVASGACNVSRNIHCCK